MFTIELLKAAHSKVKTGADFPRYIQEIKKLGLVRYEYLVNNGTTVYYGSNNYHVKSEVKYASMEISSVSSSASLRDIIAIHQQGQTDFLTFCRQAAEAGVEKWVVDTEKMMCTYYDLQGNELVAEPIPQGEY
jgi:uncharacterized protein YbcV (DUF1398 family)